MTSITRERTWGSYSTPAPMRTYNYNLSANFYSAQTARGKVKVMRDTQTPGWYKIRRESGPSKSFIFNPMSKTENEFDSSGSGYLLYIQGNPAWWERQDGSTGAGMCGYAAGSPPLLSPNQLVTQEEMGQVGTLAATRCVSKIGASNIGTWENMAEIKKTLNLLRHPISTWHKWHRSNPVYKNTVSSSANAYLLYRYGIRPLVTDVNQLLVNLAASVRSKYVTTRSSEKIRKVSMNTVTTTGVHSWTYKRDIAEEFTVRCMSLDRAISDFQFNYGLSGKTLARLWWDLIPYSFVVDWAFNVGQYIGALAQALEPASLGRVESHKWVIEDKRQVLSHTLAAPHVLVSPCTGSTKHTTVHYARYVGFRSQVGLAPKNFSDLEGWVDPITNEVRQVFGGEDLRLADAMAMIAQQIAARGDAISRFGRDPIARRGIGPQRQRWRNINS